MKIEDIFQHAKDNLLKNGEHAPMLYVEYVDEKGVPSVEIYYFADFGAEAPLEGKRYFFDLGATFGRTYGAVDLVQLTFISEAWVSQVAPERIQEYQRTIGRPHNDPRRKEYLIMQIVELEPSPSGKKQIKQSMLRAEIVRPSPETVDLVPDTREATIPHLLFPSYFLAGYASTQVSDEELQQIARTVFGRRR